MKLYQQEGFWHTLVLACLLVLYVNYPGLFERQFVSPQGSISMDWVIPTVLAAGMVFQLRWARYLLAAGVGIMVWLAWRQAHGIVVFKPVAWGLYAAVGAVLLLALLLWPPVRRYVAGEAGVEPGTEPAA